MALSFRNELIRSGGEALFLFISLSMSYQFRGWPFHNWSSCTSPSPPPTLLVSPTSVLRSFVSRQGFSSSNLPFLLPLFHMLWNLFTSTCDSSKTTSNLWADPRNSFENNSCRDGMREKNKWKTGYSARLSPLSLFQPSTVRVQVIEQKKIPDDIDALSWLSETENPMSPDFLASMEREKRIISRMYYFFATRIGNDQREQLDKSFSILSSR